MEDEMSWMIALDWVLLVAVVWSALDERLARRDLHARSLAQYHETSVFRADPNNTGE
jgi:hypothetical protein